jgi:hypothetical protein
MKENSAVGASAPQISAHVHFANALLSKPHQCTAIDTIFAAAPSVQQDRIATSGGFAPE